MKQLNERDLPVHVQVVAWLLIVNSALGLIGSFVLYTLMISTGGFLSSLGPGGSDPEGARIFAALIGYNALFATAVSALWATVSIPGLVAGVGMLARKSWARVVGIVVSVFTLISFPVGTFIGAYTLFVLFQDAAATYFTSPPAGLSAQPRPA